MRGYEQLKAEVLALHRDGKLDDRPSDAQRADWAYGNAKLSNPNVTRKMCEDAVKAKPGSELEPEFKVEHGIEIPKIRARGGESYPWRKMGVGDSFFVPGIWSFEISGAATRFGRKLNAKFLTRSVEGGVRVWRVL